MRSRDFRRHQTYRHMWRRLREDRNEHYDDLDCPCWRDPQAMARFKEQPQVCSGRCCGNQRRHEGLTLQEKRHMQSEDILSATIDTMLEELKIPDFAEFNRTYRYEFTRHEDKPWAVKAEPK